MKVTKIGCKGCEGLTWTTVTETELWIRGVMKHLFKWLFCFPWEAQSSNRWRAPATPMLVRAMRHAAHSAPLCHGPSPALSITSHWARSDALIAHGPRDWYSSLLHWHQDFPSKHNEAASKGKGYHLGIKWCWAVLTGSVLRCVGLWASGEGMNTSPGDHPSKSINRNSLVGWVPEGLSIVTVVAQVTAEVTAVALSDPWSGEPLHTMGMTPPAKVCN